MKLKGTMVIEFTDAETGAVETVTEENMVTNAVNNILGSNPMGVFYSEEELADVLAYALLLAEKHHLDIFDIVLRKIRKNGEKYPVEKARGTAKKYNEL